jgi:hypothetical protein
LPRTSNIPHVELEARLLHRFDIEALGRRDVADIFLQARVGARRW